MLLIVLLMCNRMVQKSMLVGLSGVAIDESRLWRSSRKVADCIPEDVLEKCD